jgi:hypothetical protein
MAKKEELLSLYDSENVKYSKLISIGLKPKDGKTNEIVEKIINIVFEKFFNEIKNISFNSFFSDINKKNFVLSVKNKYYLDQPIENDFIKNVSLKYLKENNKEFQILLEDLLDLGLKYNEVQQLPKVFEFYILNDLSNFVYKPYIFSFLKRAIKIRGLENDYFNVKEEEKEIFLRNNIHTRKLERYFYYLSEFLPYEKKVNIINKFKKEFQEYSNFIENKYNKEIPLNIKNFLIKKLDSYLDI